MDFASYQIYFQSVLNNAHQVPPYDNPAYLNYTKLNWSRQQRWFKVGELNPELAALLRDISTPQQWIVITEPWCGDAAHTLPFIWKLAQLNPLIRLDIQLRDSEPHLIDQYLTGAGKSVPKLIIRDAEGKDLLVWGPRPAACQALYDKLKAEHAPVEEIKIQLQWWYNQDKGVSFQQELQTALSPAGM